MFRIEDLFYTGDEGFLPLSRAALKYLLSQIKDPTREVVYTYLLLQASYKDQYLKNGKVIGRGCVEIDVEELQKFTKTKRANVYLILRNFIKEGLLEKVSNSIYRLVYYDKHCAGKPVHSKHKARFVKPSGPNECYEDPEFNEFYDFYHYALNIPPTERMRAWIEWQKLTEDEKEDAMMNITEYRRNLRKEEYAKMACNYLKDRTFKM